MVGGLVAVFATVLLYRLLRPETVNTWPITNLPVRDGGILCFGDSLVAGVGAETKDRAYPAQLQDLLRRKVVAVGTLGQTAEEGLKKLQKDPRLRAPVVIVTLGGNDLMNRVELEDTLDALRGIFTELQGRRAVVVFTGIDSPMSSTRGEKYEQLCRETGVILVPNILKGIFRNEDLKADTVHPNGDGYAIFAQRVADTLLPYLEVVAKKPR